MTDFVNDQARPLVGVHQYWEQREPSINTRRSTKSILDDPATAIALAMAFANIFRDRGTPIPSSAIELLQSHIDEGDPTCALVIEHLQALSLIAEVTLTAVGGVTHGQA